MNIDLFKWNKPLALPPQLKWQFAHEPELLGWTIRARNYNTFVANAAFILMSLIILGCIYFVYHPPAPGESHLSEILTALGFYITFTSLALSMTHQRMNFAYRFTHSGVECCEWKDFPEWGLTFMKWLIGITFFIFMSLTSIDSAFLIAGLVCTGNLILTYLSMNGKSYRNMHTQYHHLIYEWEDLTQLALATNREVVDFKFIHFNKRFERIISWNQNIFCKRKQKEEIFNFIKCYIPANVPCIEAKVNVPYGTD